MTLTTAPTLMPRTSAVRERRKGLGCCMGGMHSSVCMYACGWFDTSQQARLKPCYLRLLPPKAQHWALLKLSMPALCACPWLGCSRRNVRLRQIG